MSKDYTKKEVLAAIKGSGAIISTVAERLKCDWATARKYIEKWDDTKADLENEKETMLDKAENTIHEAIEDKDIQAAKWYLSTKGKKRGYADKQEIEHSGNIVYLPAQAKEKGL